MSTAHRRAGLHYMLALVLATACLLGLSTNNARANQTAFDETASTSASGSFVTGTEIEEAANDGGAGVLNDQYCAGGYTCIFNCGEYRHYAGCGKIGFADNKNNFFHYNNDEGRSADNTTNSVAANHLSCKWSYLYEKTTPWDRPLETRGVYIYFGRYNAGDGASRDPDLRNGGGNGQYNDLNFSSGAPAFGTPHPLSSNWYRGCPT